MLAPFRRRVIRKATYQGRPCLRTTYYMAGEHGQRVVIYQWLDDGDVELSAIKGDGRTLEFTRYEDTTIPQGSSADAILAAATALATKHFTGAAK
jgi:hypothetical protein